MVSKKAWPTTTYQTIGIYSVQITYTVLVETLNIAHLLTHFIPYKIWELSTLLAYKNKVGLFAVVGRLQSYDGIRGRISWPRAELAENKSPSFGQQGGPTIINHSSRSEGGNGWRVCLSWLPCPLNN